MSSNVDNLKKIENKKEAVRLLFEAGADRHHPDRKGETPLAIAKSGRRPGAKDARVLVLQPPLMLGESGLDHAEVPTVRRSLVQNHPLRVQVRLQRGFTTVVVHGHRRWQGGISLWNSYL